MPLKLLIIGPMNYKQQKEYYENLWKEVGPNWENESGDFKTRIPQGEILDFIEFLKKQRIKEGKVLDVGCGGGRHTILFAKYGFDSYGIDCSKTAIDLAKKDAIDKEVKVNFRVGDVLNLPYLKNSFDIINDTGCLHHLKKTDWRLYLKNILRVLRKGGYYKLFAFSTNAKFLTGKKIPKKKNWVLQKGHYCHFFTKREIKEFFSKYFKILKISGEQRGGEKNRYLYVVAYMKRK